jgi:hypothetical protein
MKFNFTPQMVLASVTAAADELTPTPSDVSDTVGDRIVPLDLRQWLARLRLLDGVPFNYLAADSALLPPESIRFFYLDRNWTDALVQGALSVGTVNTADRAQLAQLYTPVRNEIDEEERFAREPGGEPPQQGPAGEITGFLLRSKAVSGWPGIHVRAYRQDVGPDNEVVPESDPNRIKVLRLERLAPAVLLALFDGVPQVVHIEEPRQGVQFGVLLQSAGDANQFTAFVTPRDVNTSKDAVGTPNQIPMFFRPGAPGVLDLKRTAAAFESAANTHIGSPINGAQFALEMIRFPYRQVFGDPSHASTPLGDVFRPSLSLAQLETKFRENI